MLHEWEESSSRKDVVNFPTAQPVSQRRKQRGRHLQLQHTTQLLIYADPLPFQLPTPSGSGLQVNASCSFAQRCIIQKWTKRWTCFTKQQPGRNFTQPRVQPFSPYLDWRTELPSTHYWIDHNVNVELKWEERGTIYERGEEAENQKCPSSKECFLGK